MYVQGQPANCKLCAQFAALTKLGTAPVTHSKQQWRHQGMQSEDKLRAKSVNSKIYVQRSEVLFFVKNILQEHEDSFFANEKDRQFVQG